MTRRLIGFRHFISGSLALASLNLACRDHVPTFPQRSLPSLLTTAACGGLRPFGQLALVKEDLDAGSAPEVEFIATIADGVKHLRDQHP